ncbi:MAG: T9SS type A sorting domain-containing protein, partial [Bacteroidota bacterium]
GNPIKWPRYQPFTDPGATVNDNYYSPSSFTVTVDASKVIHHKPGYYYVTYNTTDGSGNNSDEVTRLVEVVDVSTGLNQDMGPSGVMIFPNPVDQGLLNVHLNGIMVKKVIISDLLGKILLSSLHATDKVKLDISMLQKGIYFILIENSMQEKHMQKILVK